MSREIELKVPLTEGQFSKIEEIFLGNERISSPGVLSIHGASRIFKSDEYFSLYKTHEERIKNKELRVIRIRTEKKTPLEPSGIDIYGDESENHEKSYFCIKRKSLENGVEFNSEYETFIESPEVLREFFSATGYTKWFEKTKDALSVFCTISENPEFTAHAELEKVNGLSYIEIEYTKDNLVPEKVRKNLEKILIALGVDPKKRDSRSWAEILENEN